MRLGVDVETVFLGPPSRDPEPQATYLSIEDLSDANALWRALRPYAASNWGLVLAHRYRAYQGALRAGLPAQRMVAVAHEFGFFARPLRRLDRLLRARRVRFAGVSAVVAAELAGVAGAATVLPNIVDADVALHPPEEARRLLGLPADGLVVGVVGRLHYKKRPALALQAFERLQMPAHLIFVGDGPERDQLDAADGVVYAGNVPEARRCFPGFDVLLHTGDRDAFGMVILEAMAAGVPVVTGRGSGPQYILGDLGFYAETDDAAGYAAALTAALTGQLEDGSNRIRWAQSAAARITEEFSLDALARALEELLPTNAG